MSRSIVYLSTYPPRRCGIATFTRDLRAAVGGGRVYALGPTDGGSPENGHTDPPEVMAFLLGHDAADYRHAAIAIDGLDTGVVSLQHEYGIYGGPDGANVLAFTDRLRTPLVTTLHTVLPEPGERQQAIVRELGRRSEAMVVMSETAAGLLDRRYDVDPARVRVIPHGVPDLARVDPELVKPELGLAGHRVVLSFGLIGPGKGYEAAVEAMADVAGRVPDALYVILGTTHPDLVRREGERYRDSLRERAEALGIADRSGSRTASSAEPSWPAGCRPPTSSSRPIPTSTRSCRGRCRTPWAPVWRSCRRLTCTPASCLRAAVACSCRRPRPRRWPRACPHSCSIRSDARRSRRARMRVDAR